jgi:hypothetical protein
MIAGLRGIPSGNFEKKKKKKISKPFEYSFRLENFNVHFKGRPACLIESAMNCSTVVKPCSGEKER